MEALQGVARPPGFSVPIGHEPDSEDVVAAWLNDLGPGYATQALQAALEAAGVVTLYDLTFTRAELVDMGFTIQQARRVKEAADNVRQSLGYAPVLEEAVQAQAEVVVQQPAAPRGEKRPMKPVPFLCQRARLAWL